MINKMKRTNQKCNIVNWIAPQHYQYDENDGDVVALQTSIDAWYLTFKAESQLTVLMPVLSHLRWILNLIATLQKSATMNSFVTTGLAFWQDKHRQNSFPILASLALNTVAACASQVSVERAFSVCGDICI